MLKRSTFAILLQDFFEVILLQHQTVVTAVPCTWSVKSAHKLPDKSHFTF